MAKQANPDRSQRQLRVAEQIRHVLVETLQHGLFLRDEDGGALDTASVTIAEVRISPDLKNATAYTNSLLGKNIDALLPALNKAAGHFQKEIARKLTLKFTPRIKFVSDEVVREADKIERLLHKIHQEEKS